MKTEGSNPFSLIYNHVIAWPIHELEIVTHATPYEPIPEIAQHIQTRLEQNPLPFDNIAWKLWGTSFRRSRGILTEEIGPGTYSQYRYTNLDRALRSRVPDPTRWFNTIVLGAVVITADNKIYFGKRPDNAHLSPGRIDIPCGHPTGIEELPSNESLPKALRIVLERDIGYPVTIDWVKPLVHICEEPKWADDLIFTVLIKQTSDDLLESKKSDKEMLFVNFTDRAMMRLILSNSNTSRPVHLSLAYLGRELFGEEWFLRLCRDQN